MDDFYTVKQAAIALKVHPLTIRRYIREGKLKAFRVGGNVRISINDLRALIQSFAHSPKSVPIAQIATTKSFALDDPLFRLKARGISIGKLEEG